MDNMQDDHKNGGHWDKPWHHGYYGHGPHWLRILLAFIILMVVFWLGMECGRYGGNWGHGYHHHRIMPYYGGMMYEGPAMGVPNMMPGMPVNGQPQANTPVNK